MKALNADVALWPVWCDYEPDEWNSSSKYEYADQAALCGNCVLLVNPFCADADAMDSAAGGAVHFRSGSVVTQMRSGGSGIMIAEV